jgi:hypothetical protein
MCLSGVVDGLLQAVDVNADIATGGAEGGADGAQNPGRIDSVVDDVERGDHVVAPGTSATFLCWCPSDTLVSHTNRGGRIPPSGECW